MTTHLPALDEPVRRWRAFAAKIRQRADEWHAQGFEEALAMKRRANGTLDNAYYLFWSGVGGQLRALRDKVEDTFENQLRPAFEQNAGPRGAASGRQAPAEALWRLLQQEKNELSEHLLGLACTNIADFDAHEDLEAQYRQILLEHERIRQGFACVSCGAGLTLPGVCHAATYVACPYCRTQNTFQPGSAAYGLPALAEKLAEQRAGEARRRWESAAAQATPWSAASSASWHEHKRREIDLYVDYIETRFNELDRIVPGLKAQNDLIRRSRIQEMKKALGPPSTTSR